MRLTVTEVMDAIGGVLHSDNDSMKRVVTGITWDSRKIKPGDLFLAMPGERVNGNDYIVKAIGNGAGMVVCTEEPTPAVKAIAGEFACPLAVVEDGLEAIAQLARYWRTQLRCVVVGVTGSTGKTSTKDLLTSVLSTRYRTVATQGNNNNELGIPYTVLRADTDTEVLVVEMGMRGLGQIEYGCSIASPDIGVVTNVGVCHMELLGSQEAIAQAKGEMLAALSPSGLAVVNNEDAMTEYMLESAGVAQKGTLVMRFGCNEGATTKVGDVSIKADGCAKFDFAFGEAEPTVVELSVPGEHNVMNALAAACVGNYLGIPSETIAEGLANAGASGMRMEVTECPGGFTVVNDAYNANPDSMKAALATVSKMECAGKRIAVLGDMGELGDNEAALHREVGAAVAGTNIDLLLCVGPLASNIADGALEAGFAGAILRTPAVEDACEFLKEQVAAGDLVLVKASRFMGLERIVEEIAK